jgi:ABC-type sugar transport system substrate-binding protein
MRKTSFILILLLVVTVLFTLSACGPSEEQSTTDDPVADDSVADDPVAEEPLKIAYSSVGDPNPWFVGFADDLEKAAIDRGYIFEVAHAEASVQKQISDVEDLVVKNPDILVLGPIDMEGSAPALEIAKEAGVPVMLVNRDVVGVAGEDYISLLSSDFEFVGAEQARLIEEAFPASFEKIRVLELHGTPGGGNTIGLSKGFRDWIEANDSRIEIVGAQLGDYNRAQALKTMENVIQSGLEFDAIFGHFDEEAIGAITALENSDIPVGSDPEAGEIIIVGNGGTVDGLKAIQAGKYYGLITVSPYYGEQTLDIIEAYFAGEEIPGFTKVEDFQITGANIDEYMWFGF